MVIALLSCAGGPAPQSSLKGDQYQSFHDSRWSFEYPASWRMDSRWPWAGSMGGPLFYLTNAQLHNPCIVVGSPPQSGSCISCGWPIDTLQSGEVIVTWSELSVFGYVPGSAPGEVISVDGRSGRFTKEAPGICKAIGGDLTITVSIPIPSAPGGFLSNSVV